MADDRTAPDRALARLAAFVGEWVEQVDVPGVPSGRTTFEWILDGRFLLQRSEIADPAFPDSTAIIAVHPDGETYTQHYFDSRGVVRVYAMTFDGLVWTLERSTPDFTPLHFGQRFVGTLAEDGSAITGQWQTATDGGPWARDLDLTYSRVR